MSGPKTVSYSVEDNARLIRRALDELLKQIRKEEIEYSMLVEEINQARGKYRIEIAAPDIRASSSLETTSSVASLESYLVNIRLVKNQTRAELNSTITRAKIKRVMEAYAPSDELPEKSISDLIKESRSKKIDSVAQEHDRRRKTVDKIMERLSGEAKPEEKAAVEETCRRYMAAETRGFACPLEDQLKYQVQKANDITKVLQKEANEASDLLCLLRGLESPELEQIKTQLRLVQEKQVRLTDGLRTSVQKTYLRAKAEADKQYAGEVLNDVISKLGYDVEDEVSTLFINGGSVHFQKPDWKDYWVRIRVDERQNSFNMNVVRLVDRDEPPTKERLLADKTIEEKWCGEFEAILEEFKKAGLMSRILRREAPGTFPVQTVVDQDRIPHRKSLHMMRARQAKKEVPV
jgi:hypothetical protein